MKGKQKTEPSEAAPCKSQLPSETFASLIQEIRNCRICRDQPRYGKPLPHEPRPVVWVSQTAKICIAGQAPGTRVHEIGRPFSDPSGVRLRQWLELDEDVFYDTSKIAILGMGFCFPGQDNKGSDLPPRRECAEVWRERLFAQLPDLKLLLLIGGYAQKWHLARESSRDGVTETVRRWREISSADSNIKMFPLPHPSWRNNHWLKQNPWFEQDLLPVLRSDIQQILS